MEKMSAVNIAPYDELQAVADRIRDRLQRHVSDMVAIGADLRVAKEMLGHGHFGDWLEREFSLTVRSAQLYMRAAEWAEGKSEIISHLPPVALRLLSAPSTPEPIQAEVVEAIRSGTDVDFQEVERRIKEERWTARLAKKQARRREARLRGKSPEYQKRLEREIAREKAAAEQRAQEYERIIDEARSILHKLPTEDLDRLQELSAKRFIYLRDLLDRRPT
jgi:hypothetical protein